MLQLRLFERRIAEASAFFRENNIEPVLIKGWAAAQVYPESFQRYFTDIDLLVPPDKYENAVKCLERFDNKHLIDLHKGARHLDSLSFENLFANSKIVECGETEIRILRPEDHLRVLCVHWLNDGGADREKLWDVYYAVENRPPDFDWDRCLNVVGEKRKKWIICAVGLAQKYLNLNLENTPLGEIKIEIPRWLTKTIEKEWQSDARLLPLEACLNDRRRLWQQIKKRFPPNAVQATIEMEGDFDEKSRLKYQLGNVFQRLKPSVRRITKNLLSRRNG